MMVSVFFFFFFSSRRRHTRCGRDWSSDVCSSDLTRLQHHLDYFRTSMNASGAIGKKLGFITQEIGREINTLGSKAYHADLQKIVVEMKDYLEKIKRSEEHTSELQSRPHLVCRLLLEKK